ncbi:MAG: putative DNA binding domain-containing protein [Ignavibacteriales bacterium]|nr:putative DNA binding domain-containing protein [Ignavibacteriales bacterium]
MKTKEFLLLLEEGEGFQLEFKRKVTSPAKIARALIGFANTRGGRILFGVDDDRSVVGVESEKTEVEMIETAGQVFCDPAIEPVIDIISHRGKDVIVVTIAESSQKPHSLLVDDDGTDGPDSKVLIRVKDKTVVASKEVVKILRSESPDAPPLRISIGDTERSVLDYLDANERITVKEFGKLVNISDRRASRALIQLVRAGVLRIHTHEKEDFYTLAY